MSLDSTDSTASTVSTPDTAAMERVCPPLVRKGAMDPLAVDIPDSSDFVPALTCAVKTAVVLFVRVCSGFSWIFGEISAI